MFSNKLRPNKYFHIKPLLHSKSLDLKRKISILVPRVNTCCCNRSLKDQRHNILIYNIRVHSTQSDQHRQKVIIETSSPNVIDKLDFEKVLPLDKELLDSKKSWKDRIDPYVKLARWDKPIGIYLLYWPCAWSISLASVPGNIPPSATLQTAALFLVGAGLMRGAGCTINDLWDRDLDAQVERTKDRPLVTGAITVPQAMVFLGAQLTLALGILLQLNCYSVVLGASSLFLVVTYPLAKRFTNYPQLFLGATFNFGALLGYSAIQGTVDASVAVPLYLGALAWTQLYDTIYAHQDKVDDARAGIKSTALTFGARTKPALAAALCAALAGVLGAGHAAALGAPFYVGVAAGAAHGARQIYTLDIDNPEDCGAKFRSNSTIGLLILLGILGGGYSQYMENRQTHAGKENLQAVQSCLLNL